MGHMRKSRISWLKQVRLIEHFVSGSTARCSSRLIGVNKSTGRAQVLTINHQVKQRILASLRKLELAFWYSQIPCHQFCHGLDTAADRRRGHIKNQIHKSMAGYRSDSRSSRAEATLGTLTDSSSPLRWHVFCLWATNGEIDYQAKVDEGLKPTCQNLPREYQKVEKTAQATPVRFSKYPCPKPPKYMGNIIEEISLL